MAHGSNTHFQYPQPDRYPCNPLPQAAASTFTHCFQYPQPDRYPCNVCRRMVSLRRHGLSVSSTGSISLQPYLLLFRPSRLLFPFSILNRIDIPATEFPWIASLNTPGLSVSSTGSISLQLGLYPGVTACASDFQYPQPDRYPCNCLKSGWCAFA